MKPYEIWQNGWAVMRARWHLRVANQVGDKVRIWGRPSIQNRGQLVVGERVRLVSTIATLELVTEAGGRLDIGAWRCPHSPCSSAGGFQPES